MAGTNTAVAADEHGSGVITTANTFVDTVTFTARDVDQIEVVNVDGADWLWFRVDGTDPVVGGKKAFAVPPGVGASVVISPPGGGATVVKLIAATPTKYLVSEVTA